MHRSLQLQTWLMSFYKPTKWTDGSSREPHLIHTDDWTRVLLKCSWRESELRSRDLSMAQRAAASAYDREKKVIYGAVCYSESDLCCLLLV